MTRAVITIRCTADRERAKHWVDRAPLGMRLEFKGQRRSVAQNALMWARLTDLSVQLRWHGKHLSASDWKIVLLDALKREHSRVVPNIDGTGFVDLGRSSSDLSKDEMAQFLDLIEAFGAQHGVVFNDPASVEEESPAIAPDDEQRRAPELV